VSTRESLRSVREPRRTAPRALAAHLQRLLEAVEPERLRGVELQRGEHVDLSLVVHRDGRIDVEARTLAHHRPPRTLPRYHSCHTFRNEIENSPDSYCQASFRFRREADTKKRVVGLTPVH
jgi:hypothetical protein